MVLHVLNEKTNIMILQFLTYFSKNHGLNGATCIADRCIHLPLFGSITTIK